MPDVQDVDSLLGFDDFVVDVERRMVELPKPGTNGKLQTHSRVSRQKFHVGDQAWKEAFRSAREMLI